jgi:hypothetical protein
MHLLGVAPGSRTKSSQELIRESNLASTLNVDPFFLLIRESVIRFILSHYIPLLRIDGNKFLVPLGKI